MLRGESDMATNWNAVLANINNSNDILAILKKILPLLDGKVDTTTIDEVIAQLNKIAEDGQITIDEALETINFLQQKIDEKTSAFNDAIEAAAAAGAGANGWDENLVAVGTSENKVTQKVFNDNTTQYVPYFSSLKTLPPRKNNQVVIVRAYDENFKMQGGGRVIFIENDTEQPNDVFIFEGTGGNWHRIDWKEPSIFDAGLDGTNDAKIKFPILYEEVSRLGLSLNLKKKTIKLDKLDLVDNTHLFNGSLDFTSSAENIRYGRSAIMSKKTDRNLSVDFESNQIYQGIEYLDDVRLVNIKILSVGTVGHLYKFKNLKLINFEGEWTTDSMFKFIGGWHGTPLINDTPTSYNIIDPINGWCSDIELTNCRWKGDYIKDKLSSPIHFVACKDVTITGGNVDANLGYRIDIYNKSFKVKDVDYKNTNTQIVEDTIAGTAPPDAVAMYIGQNCYDITVDGGNYTDFANKCIYVEAASQITIRNIVGKCNHPNSVAKFIDLQPNYRNAENTYWGNVADVSILNNRCNGVLFGIMSSPYNAVRSLKNIDIKNNTIETRATLQSIVVIGMDGYTVSDNTCDGSLFLGSNNTRGTVRNNSFFNEANYALFVNDVGYGVYPDFDNNAFQVAGGSVIYNNSTSGYGKLRGGRLVSYDRSPLMQKGLNPGNINAEDFDFGGEKLFSYTQNLNLASGAKTLFYILNPLFKEGWSSSINLQNMDDLFNSGISIAFTSTVKNGSIAVFVENKGVAVNQDFGLIVSIKPVLSNTFLN